jgi:hypothetical protein
MRRKALIGSAVTAAVLPLALMSPVHADVRRFHDSRTDESSYIGIRWVRVDNSTSERNKLKVVVRIGKIPPPPATGPRLDLFIDTDVQNPGPEYWLHSEQDYGLYHVHHGWSRHGQFIATTCAGGTINHPSYISFVGDDRLVVEIKRGCIDKPSQIRVAVRTSLRGHPHAYDWAKAYRKFLPWVGR